MKFVERSQSERKILEILNRKLTKSSQIVGITPKAIEVWASDNGIKKPISDFIMYSMLQIFGEIVYGGRVIRRAGLTLEQFEEQLSNLMEQAK